MLSCSDPTYRNDYVLSLPSGTVECRLDSATRLCKPTVEDAFLEIRLSGESDPQWEVYDKSGTLYTFGASPASRTGSSLDPLFVPSSGSTACSYVASWGLSRIQDLNGNYISVSYDPQSVSDGVLYPLEIAYGGNTNHLGMGDLYSVDFHWIDRPASNRVTSSMGGLPATISKLLNRIHVRYNGPGARPVRSYFFEYAYVDGTTPANIGAQSYLATVSVSAGAQACDDDTKTNQQLKDGGACPFLENVDGEVVETAFLYQADRASSLVGFATDKQENPTSVNLHRVDSTVDVPACSAYTDSRDSVASMDINGDGFSDIVETVSAQTWSVFLGSPAGYGQAVAWDAGVTCDDGPPALRNVRNLSRQPTCSGAWESYSFSRCGTVDLTGDGIPDFVKVDEEGSWTVRRGELRDGASIGGFASESEPWTAPAVDMYHSRHDRWFMNWYYGYNNGATGLYVYEAAADDVDLIDMNGDGLPDAVDATAWSSASPYWQVSYNTGSGFGTPTPFRAYQPWLRYTTHFNLQVVGLTDINGDGLPDQIVTWDHTNNAGYPGFWKVRLNTGHEFGAEQLWPLPSLSPGSYAWPSDGLRKVVDEDTDVVRDFFDINGDGLPDVVDSCAYSSSNPVWQVFLNRGSGFSQTPIDWPAPSKFIREIDSGKTLADVMDADGDGLVDYVKVAAGVRTIYRNRAGAWCPSAISGGSCTSTGAVVGPRLDGGPPHLLIHFENGIGSATDIDYRPSTEWNVFNAQGGSIEGVPFHTWTVTEILRDDGFPTGMPAGASHLLGSSFAYADAHFDPGAREFRGFGEVKHWDREGNLTLTEFHQDGVLKGKVKKVDTHVWESPTPQTLRRRIENSWQCASRDSVTQPYQVVDCPAVVSAGESVWGRLIATHSSDFQASPTAVSSTLDQEFDDCGNVTRIRKEAPLASPVTTHSRFRCGPWDHVWDKPEQVWVVEHAAGGDKLLQEKWFQYDVRVNVEKVHSWLDEGAPSACPGAGHSSQGGCVSTSMFYDYSPWEAQGLFGNLTRVIDANGVSTTTQYDPATRIYARTVIRDAGWPGNPGFQHAVSSQFDPGCGKKIWQTVPYWGMDPFGMEVQPATQYQYDEFCRLVATALPDEEMGQPQQLIEYFLGARGKPTVIRSWRREPNRSAGNAYVPGAIPDNPPMQGYVASAVIADGMGRVIQEKHEAVVAGALRRVAAGTRIYNSVGNILREYAPFTTTVALNAYKVPASSVGTTVYQYDSLQRVTRVTEPNGKYRTIEHNVGLQTTLKDECYNSGLCPGSKTIEKRDGFGRAIESLVYERKSTGEEVFLNRSGTTYDGLGRVIETRQGSTASSWQTANPNTRILVTYDSLGRKIRTVDPDSGTWLYAYDPAGNLTDQADPKPGQDVGFSYDRLNRLRQKMRYVAGAPTEVDTYTYSEEYDYPEMFGRLLEVVQHNGGGTLYNYDIRGRVTAEDTTIVAEGVSRTASVNRVFDEADHLVAMMYPDSEYVTYEYDEVGQLTGITGTAQYLKHAEYDIFGRPTEIKHGNDVIDERLFGDKSANFRLLALESRKGTAEKLQYGYSFQDNGLLASITDTLMVGASPLNNSATHTYDGMGRLRKAQRGSTMLGEYDYSPLGNLMLKDEMNAAGGMQTKDFTYSAPHTVATVNGVPLGHDANGNRMSKAGHTYTYDRDDRVETITAGGRTVRFVYDHAGQRTAKVVDPGTANARVTLYYGGIAEVEGAWITKYYSAGGRMIASNRVFVPQLAGLADPNDRFIQVSRLAGGDGIALLVAGKDVSAPFACVAVMLSATLLAAPWRRRAVIGVHLRHGQVILVTIVFGATTLPLSGLRRPAWAGGGGPTNTPAITPTPPGAASGLQHYHLDHLGSVHAITNSSGAVTQYIRYKPYGEPRGHYDAAGNLITGGNDSCGDDAYCHEFTGYDREPISGLQYAGARMYDPDLGMFLTHDPAGQFANPYNYAGWNPANLVDPSGMTAEIIVGGNTSGPLLPVNLPGTPSAYPRLSLDPGGHGPNLGPTFAPQIIIIPIAIVTGGLGEVPGASLSSEGGSTGGSMPVIDRDSLFLAFGAPEALSPNTIIAIIDTSTDTLTFVYVQSAFGVGVSGLVAVQMSLDAASIALGTSGAGELVSFLPDLLNAGISASQGDIEGAQSSLWAGLPFVGIGGNLARLARASKAVNLPAWRKVGIDIAHVLDRHTVSGPFAAGRTTFPGVMSEKGIERAIREAYRYGQRVGGQGDRVLIQGASGGLTIEMWLNRATRQIETAYPVVR